MQKKYRMALLLQGKSQQEIADKFNTSRQIVHFVITGKSIGDHGKSKLIKDYLDGLVKEFNL